ncbi:MAG TPA: DUF4384 domain-containing protein [Candidatus Krumholzibacteria bacterium]|nr:DUF4384 domain-containing protein [Candidatus Krumholzibacteria bacterium]
MKMNPTPLILSLLMMSPVASVAVTPAREATGGGVTIRANIPQGAVLNTGDRISFDFQSRDDAAVVVFNIDSRGYVHLLYPLSGVEVAQANTYYTIPPTGSELVIDSPTGAEFVFALAIPDPSSVDARELEHLRSTDLPGGDPYQITGDPFIAANIIAAELVRGISHSGATFGYAQFYVNQRVEYPCYLCGACDGPADDTACSEYRVVQSFDRRSPLAYPMRRGYDMVERGADIFADGSPDPADSDVVVNFYPYGSEVRYVDPDAYWYPYGYGGLYDPYYWYGPGYYPYCGTGWSVSIGWGWGWGWGSGYYCSGWYAPPCSYYPCYPGYPSYPSGGYTYPEKFKSRYKSSDQTSGTLASNRTRVAQRDGSFRIAQSDVQKSVTKVNRTAISANARAATRATVLAGRGESPRVKTSVNGYTRGGKATVRGAVPNQGRGGSTGVTRSPSPSRGGSGGTIKRGPSGSTRGSVKGTPARGSSGYKGTSRGSSGGGVKSGGSSRGYSGGAPAARGGSAGRSAGHGAKGSSRGGK